jgi:23S rRNA pseudouridine2605 synthase
MVMTEKNSNRNGKTRVSKQTFGSGGKSSSSYSRKKYEKNNYNDENRDKKKNSFGSESDKKRRFNSSEERPKRTYKRDDERRAKPRFNDDESSRTRRFNSSEERPKRTYKRDDERRAKPRFNDDESSRTRRFNSSAERPKRTDKRDDERRAKPRFKDDESSRTRRFNSSEERPKRTYKRDDERREKPRFNDDESSKTRRFNDSEERPQNNYVRVSEPVDSRERRKDKEKKISNNVKVESTGEIGKVRLNKFISNSGVCSRREADTFIKAGVVSVNGVVVTELGVKISPTDEIKFNDEILHGEKKVYLLMNKPKGFVTTVEDPHAEKTVMTIVRNYCTERIYPVGRLDKNTTGVLLFTNDGDLTKTLTHPSYGKKKIYAVGLDKNLTKNDMTRLADGVELEDGVSYFDEISYSDEDDKRKIGVEIHSGKNRIVRRMFEHLGYKITKLDRVYFGGFTKAKLRRGECRFLSEQEINSLKMGAYE